MHTICSFKKVHLICIKSVRRGVGIIEAMKRLARTPLWLCLTQLTNPRIGEPVVSVPTNRPNTPVTPSKNPTTKGRHRPNSEGRIISRWAATETIEVPLDSGHRHDLEFVTVNV